MSNKPVLIIGAGLGGLSLAQSLLKRKIPFRIFERDTSHIARGQGWAISLHGWLISELCNNMRNDEAGLRALAPTASLGLPSVGVIYSLVGKDRKELFRFGEGTPQPFVRAERAKLRDWLGKDVNVEWNKKFTRYKEMDDGVVVEFEDGTVAEGAAVVGADGINSRVRNQLLPEAEEPQHLPIGLIVGEVQADRGQYQRWLQLATSFSVAFSDTLRLFIGLKSVSEDLSTATVYWMFGWFDETAAHQDYWTEHASPAELHSFVLSHLNGVEEAYAEPFRATSIDGILCPPLKVRDMMPSVQPLGRITLLGDAVHPMAPFRGEGGNMAIKDAMVLADALNRHAQGHDIANCFKEYEAEMIDRAGKSVARSRESISLSQGIFQQ